MRINHENKSVDMEARDINYILPAYVRSYLFYSKNEMPERIIFPMFPSVKVDGTEIPIEYVPPLGAVAIEIAKDGSSVPEVTPAQETALDEKDEEIKRLKGRITELETPTTKMLEELPEIKSPAKAAFAKTEPKEEHETAEVLPPTTPLPTPSIDRKPNLPPGGDIGPGLSPSDMHARDRRDQARTARDLKEEPDIDESAEKGYEKEVSRGEDGKPIVEDNSSASNR